MSDLSLSKYCRKNCFLVVLLLVVVLSTSISAQPSGLRIVESSLHTRHISQHGVTWHFDREVEFGQFANGDYWVVGPVTIIEINPISTDTAGRIRHGSMLNPTYGDVQGFDNAMARHSYSASNNVARPNGIDMSVTNPLKVQSGSLVSSITHDTAARRPQLADVAILTILDDAPRAGSLRPPWSGSTKLVRWNVSDIRWDLRRDNVVERTPDVLSTMPSIQTLERWVERPWFEYTGGTWTNRYIPPSNNRPDYGRDVANQLGQVSLALLLDFPRAQVEELMVSYLQVGIDLYGVTKSASNLFNNSTQGHFWHGGGGISHGRKWPILFAGLMFNDTNILEYVDAGGYRHRWDSPNWEAESGYPIFQEEQQMFIVAQGDIDQSRMTSDNRTRHPYTSEHLGLPEWGEQHMFNPQKDGSNWNAAYRDIVSNSIMSHVLSAMMFEHTGQTGKSARDLWNWEPIFDYMDRYWIHVDPSAGSNRARQFVIDMWQQYRDRYGPVWEP